MAAYPMENGSAEIGTVRNIEASHLTFRLTQRQLAARCTALSRPVTDSVVSRTERGRRLRDVDDLVALAAAFGTSLLTVPLSSSEADPATAMPNGVREGV
ncbi:helix-turn-helix domain-containing protein [Streptomyces sp. NPDC005774]|uniref:helix-turn-helix domain-containing protein n=1 Tax=Streptomyces sp. NPDC005774 TaxID=3364728 RepID=UPI00367F14A7